MIFALWDVYIAGMVISRKKWKRLLQGRPAAGPQPFPLIVGWGLQKQDELLQASFVLDQGHKLVKFVGHFLPTSNTAKNDVERGIRYLSISRPKNLERLK